jgi:hypothetical protein
LLGLVVVDAGRLEPVQAGVLVEFALGIGERARPLGNHRRRAAGRSCGKDPLRDPTFKEDWTHETPEGPKDFCMKLRQLCRRVPGLVPQIPSKASRAIMDTGDPTPTSSERAVMNTRVEFLSNKFPACEGEEELVNPGIWGKLLAEYLAENLERMGFEPQEPITEDWGYYIGLENPEFALGVGCSHQSGPDDSFVCILTPDKPVIRKLFKKIDTTEQVGRVASALDKLLRSDPDIRDVRWESE